MHLKLVMLHVALKSISMVDVRERWYFYVYLHFRMHNDLLLNLYKIFLVQGTELFVPRVSETVDTCFAPGTSD